MAGIAAAVGPPSGVPQPPGLGGKPEHGLHLRQGHQFGIAEPGRDAHRPPRPHCGESFSKSSAFT
jgi:hypothetical protein